MPVGVGYDPRVFASGQTPLLQREQQRMQEAMQFLDQLVSGQRPAGLTGRLSERNRIIGLLGDIISEFGPGAVSQQALTTWVEPALVGDLASRDAALGFLAQQAALTGQVDPRLQAFLGGQMGTTMMDRQTRGNLLASLADRFAGDEWFRQAFSQHLQSVAPGGNLMGTPVANWGAAAAPFFAMQNVLGGPEFYAAAGLPGLQLPMGGEFMPVGVQNYLTSLQRAAAAAAGMPEIGPQGPARQTARERAADLLRDAQRAFNDWYQAQFGSLVPGAQGFLGSTAAAPLTAATQAMSAAATPQAAESGDVQQARVQALQSELLRSGASAQWAISQLLANQAQLVELLGPQGYQQLFAWAQTNLPPNGRWLGTGFGDPISALISTARR